MEEFIDILDTLEDLNFNALFVQIRPNSDAIYKSYINPWSEYLTGEQGKYPGYDPLLFMIEESHKRNIKFHAWLNPYRITTSGTNIDDLSKNHPARINPSWVLSYNNALFYNPQNNEVINYIVTTVFEIVKYYDVDGIHFDDYFYPYGYQCIGNGNIQREAVNNMIRNVNNVIKNTVNDVKFGVSPFGVWKNNTSDCNGSNTNSMESYYNGFADSVRWIQEGTIDYIVPQIYWTIDNKNSPYEELVNWWSSVVKDTCVELYIGQGIYKEEIANEIEKQVSINRNEKQVLGSIYFSMSSIRDNIGNVKNKLKRLYSNIMYI